MLHGDIALHLSGSSGSLGIRYRRLLVNQFKNTGRRGKCILEFGGNA